MSTPGVVNYPATLDDAVSLIETNNNATSQLSAAINATDLLIPVIAPAKFSNSGFATLVDNPSSPTQIEIVKYESKSGSNLVVPTGGRGQQSTIAQAFAVGAVVEQRPTARHHTTLADSIRAIESKVGIGADTPGGSGEVLVSDAVGQALWRAITQNEVSGLVIALADKLSKSDTTLQQAVSNLRLSKGAPTFELNDTVGANTGIVDVTGGNLRLRGLSDALLIAIASGIVTFPQIPVLPAINPTTANQAVRRDYVDGKKTAWSTTFFIQEPASHPISSFDNAPKSIVPPGTQITVTGARLIWSQGSATAGGVVTFEFRRHPASGQASQTVLTTMNITDTTSIGFVFSSNITPLVLNEGDCLYVILTTRTGTITQRAVSLALVGTQQLT